MEAASIGKLAFSFLKLFFFSIPCLFQKVIPETPFAKTFLRSVIALLRSDLDIGEETTAEVARSLGHLMVKDEVALGEEVVREDDEIFEERRSAAAAAAAKSAAKGKKTMEEESKSAKG